MPDLPGCVAPGTTVKEVEMEIREAIEAQDLDSNQEDKLKRLFAREYPILTAEKRLRAIAKDVVQHFNTRGYKGKIIAIRPDSEFSFLLNTSVLYKQ